jgi:D-inositol-3-phosphate glycosyltransferase
MGRLRSRPQPESPVPSASLDFPAPGTRFEGDVVTLSGWVVFEGAVTSRVEAWLGERPLGRARLGLRREDVAALHQSPDAAVSGFELRAGVDGFEREEELELRVVATSTAGERRELGPVPVVLGGRPAPAPPSRRVTWPSGEGRRVLAFTNVLTLGGASIYLVELLREAQRTGRVVPTVVTAIDGPLRGDLEAAGIPVHLLGPLPLDDLDAYLDRADELAAWAAEGGFELVLVNTATALTLPGADVAKRLGVPAVWSIHESFHQALLWDGLGPGLREHAEAALCEAAAAVFEAEGTRRLYEDLLGERSLTLPYGLDLTRVESVRQGFDRRLARRRAGVPEEADLAICVGTVEPRKAQVQLAQAFDLVAERHPGARLAFVGSGEDEGSAALAARISTSPHRERMRMVPRTREVQTWIGMADLLVCASDVESLPMSVLEAMAWEIPVLATAIFGLPETIEDGVSGWLCEPGDVAALAAGLDSAFSADEGTRRRLGAAAREVVLTRHDMPAYAGRVAGLFDRVVDAPDRLWLPSHPPK